MPGNITLLPLPPYSPELNPVERVWLYLRERYPSYRQYQSEQAIVEALCAAWNTFSDEAGRLTTLTSYFTNEEWVILEPFITPGKLAGHPQVLGLRRIVDAAFCVLPKGSPVADHAARLCILDGCVLLLCEMALPGHLRVD